jgi:hypothetical protein
MKLQWKSGLVHRQADIQRYLNDLEWTWVICSKPGGHLPRQHPGTFTEASLLHITETSNWRSWTASAARERTPSSTDALLHCSGQCFFLPLPYVNFEVIFVHIPCFRTMWSQHKTIPNIGLLPINGWLIHPQMVDVYGWAPRIPSLGICVEIGHLVARCSNAWGV